MSAIPPLTAIERHLNRIQEAASLPALFTQVLRWGAALPNRSSSLSERPSDVISQPSPSPNSAACPSSAWTGRETICLVSQNAARYTARSAAPTQST